MFLITNALIEAHAATSAGITTILVGRPGNALLDTSAREQYRVITTLEEVVVLNEG
jgi:methionine salvage enolase-phosphatase E1